jgi:hypothetical protein
MKKVYKYENSIVIVENCDTYNLEFIKRATEVFLRQVIKERMTNGNGNTSGNISKK